MDTEIDSINVQRVCVSLLITSRNVTHVYITRFSAPSSTSVISVDLSGARGYTRLARRTKYTFLHRVNATAMYDARTNLIGLLIIIAFGAVVKLPDFDEERPSYRRRRRIKNKTRIR